MAIPGAVEDGGGGESANVSGAGESLGDQKTDDAVGDVEQQSRVGGVAVGRDSGEQLHANQSQESEQGRKDGRPQNGGFGRRVSG